MEGLRNFLARFLFRMLRYRRQVPLPHICTQLCAFRKGGHLKSILVIKETGGVGSTFTIIVL